LCHRECLPSRFKCDKEIKASANLSKKRGELVSERCGKRGKPDAGASKEGEKAE
jgi:hypothetical protein